MKKLLFQRRVIWIAHLPRREEMDGGATTMLRQRDEQGDECRKMVKRDLDARGRTVEQVLECRDFSQADLKRRILSGPTGSRNFLRD